MTNHLGRLATPLVDGQLDHDTRDRAFAHLARCATCQAEVSEQRALKARLAALGPPTIPRDLADRLLLVGLPPATSRRPRGVAPAVRPDRTRNTQGPPAESPGGIFRSLSRRPSPFRSSGAGVPYDDHFEGCLEGAPRSPGGPDRLRAQRAIWGVRLPAMLPSDAASAPPSGPSGPSDRPRTTATPPSSTPTGPWRGQVRTLGPIRRAWARKTLIGSAAAMLVALGGSAALSDARTPVAPARPAAVPTAAVAGSSDTGRAANQWNAPPLATLSVSAVYGR